MDFYRDGLWFLLPKKNTNDIDEFNSIDFHIINKNEFLYKPK